MTTEDMATTTPAGGFAGDPFAALSPPTATSGCCSDAEVTDAGSCCASPAATADAGCCQTTAPAGPARCC